MVDQYRLGQDCKLYRNTATYASPSWDEVDSARDVTLGLEKNETDISTRGNDGWEATATVRKKGSVEFELLWKPEGADFEAFRDAWLNGDSIEVAVMDGPIDTPGSQGLRATMQVIMFKRKEPLDGAVMADVSLKPTLAAQPPEWMVIA